MIDNMVYNSGPYFIWCAPLSLASSASSCVLPLHPSIMRPYSSSFSCLLTWSFSGCSSTVRMCNYCVVLCLYAFQMKVHEMHLWAISKKWFIIGWFIFSSLVKLKIHLHNSWQIYKNLIEMCRKFAWQFMTTRSTILNLMTYTMN